MASAQPAAAGQAPAAAAAAPASHPYTCNTCQVAYRNTDLQKTHMKSDWHRYNLKRRIASLPPIAAEVFSEKVLQARAETTAKADKVSFERSCDVCSKTYYSENAFRNHLLSQKHKQKLANPPRKVDVETSSVISSTFSLGEPTPMSAEEVDSDAEDEFNQVIESLQNVKTSDQRPSPFKRPTNPHPAPVSDKETDNQDDSPSTAQASSVPVWTVNSCVFCNYDSPTAPLNVHHMERFHGMFIPEKAYLVDLEGLISHLQQRVGKENQCLTCRKFKSNLFAIQTHMKDKGHCKIPYTTEEEQLDIGEFYDFRSTYSDEEEEASDSEATEDGVTGGAKLGARREVKATGADGEELEGGEDAEGWETDSSASSLDSEFLTAVPAEGHIHQFERLNKHPRHHSGTDPRHHHQADGWHSRAHKHTHAAFYDEYELHLPTGKSVGHRSMNKYFRQNLYHYPTAEERAERLAIEAAERNGDGDGDNEVSAVVRGRGREVAARRALGMQGVTDENKRVVRRAEGRAQNLELYRTKKTDWAYSKKLNNQKNYYYRYDGGG